MIVAAGFGTGLINTLASSGSVITLPLLTFLGLPPDIVGVIVVSFLLLLRPPHWVTAPGPGAWAGFIVLDTVTYMLFAGVLGVGFDLVRTYAVKALLLLAVSLSSVVVSFEGRPVNSRIGVLPGGRHHGRGLGGCPHGEQAVGQGVDPPGIGRHDAGRAAPPRVWIHRAAPTLRAGSHLTDPDGDDR